MKSLFKSYIVLLCFLAQSVFAQNSFTVPLQVFTQGDTGVVGTIDSLAASGTTNAQIDLGPQWQQYNTVACTVNVVGPSTVTVVQQLFGASLGSTTWRGGLMYQTAASSTSYATWNPTAGPQTMQSPIFDRYMVLRVQNTDATNAFGAGSTFRCVARK